jgi:fructuronate reductase
VTAPGAPTLRRSGPKPKVGIVHLGLGAFFRAHGAVYIEEAMACSGGDWGILGVSLRSPKVRDLLAPQDYVYTTVETSGNGLKPRTIAAINDVLVAPEDPRAVLEAMTAETTKIVSMTVTEKGYCRGSGATALDLDHADIRHDLSNPLPRSAPGYIVRALDARRKRGLRPFTVLSLDNLPQNGPLTRRIVLDLAHQTDPDLEKWIDENCRFPSTMVDRIVPAPTADMVARLRSECDIDDPAAVFHEPFRQWVIEDQFVDNARPDWGAVGAQIVSDVEPFEHMKLRMLNGTHSALAYIGRLAGHETVAGAMDDPAIAGFLDGMWQYEIIPGLKAPPETDLGKYASELVARYRNPEIHHQLEQIAMDGSQKLPQRILDPLFDNKAAGRPYHRLLTVIVAWIKFLQERSETGKINDPLAKDLARALQDNQDPKMLVANVLSISSVFGGYPAHEIADDVSKTLTAMTAAKMPEMLTGLHR